MSWGRQGPTWIAIKRPKTIHLVHAYFTRILSGAGGERCCSPHRAPKLQRSNRAALSRRQVLHSLHALGWEPPRQDRVQTSCRTWSNFLNAIRLPPSPDGCARMWPVRECIKKPGAASPFMSGQHTPAGIAMPLRTWLLRGPAALNRTESAQNNFQHRRDRGSGDAE